MLALFNRQHYEKTRDVVRLCLRELLQVETPHSSHSLSSRETMNRVSDLYFIPNRHLPREREKEESEGSIASLGRSSPFLWLLGMM